MIIYVIYKKTQLLRFSPEEFSKKESLFGDANFQIFETLNNKNACCQLQSSALGHLSGSQDRGSTLSLARGLAGYYHDAAALHLSRSVRTLLAAASEGSCGSMCVL